MVKVWLVKPFGTHALSWMRPINRENHATLALWDHVADIPFTGPVIKEGLTRNDLNALHMLILLRDVM